MNDCLAGALSRKTVQASGIVVGVVEELSFLGDGLGGARVREPRHVDFGYATLRGRGDEPRGIPTYRTTSTGSSS